MLEIGGRTFLNLIMMINPLLLVPLFITITRNQTAKRRKSTASRSILIAFGALLVISCGGEPLLHLIGVSFSSFKIAGGFLLFLIGMNMVMSKETGEKTSAPAGGDVAVFPLAMPLITGPGAITVSIALMGEASGSHAKVGAIVIAMICIFLLNWVCMRQAEFLVRLCGKGLDIAVRIFGLIVATIAVELVVSGVHAVFSI
ncbi:MAG: MarC family protein [Holosporales bacterium]|jgi:multiple antibiotic resistance protein|nr:MarC family protein [Holosporales bacterium]